MDASTTTQVTGNQQTNSSSQGQQSQQQQQTSLFSPEQQNLQALASKVGGQALSTGQLPGNYGISQQAFDAMDQNFNQNIAHTLAAQYGPGSPVIGGTFANMNAQLAATLGQEQFSNFNNLFNEIGNFAQRPAGSAADSSAATSQSGNSGFSYNQTNTSEATLPDIAQSSLFNALGSGLGGVVSSLFH